MRRLPAVLAAALTVGALSVPRATAATDFVLTGSRSGYVDVDVHGSLSGYEPVIRTRGRFAGYYAVPLRPMTGRQERAGGFVGLRAVSASGDTLDPMPLGRVPDVGPGRVRLYLIADGPTSVTIPYRYGNGGGTFKVKPAKVDPHFRSAPLVATGGTWSAVTAPMNVAPGSPNLAALHVSGALSGLSGVDLCVREAGAECPDQIRAPGSPLEPEQRWYATSWAETAAYGRVVGSATVDPPQPLRGGTLVAFVLSLPAK